MIANEDALRALLDNTEPDAAYTLTTDRRGHPNLLIHLNGAEWRLHSSYDAVKEGETFAREHYRPCDELIVYGLGFGYHIAPLLDQLAPGQRLCVFETNLPILKLALAHAGVGSIVADERVTLYAGPDMRSLRRFLFARLHAADSSLVINYGPAAETRPEDVRLLHEDVKLCGAFYSSEPVPDTDTLRQYISGLTPPPRKLRIGFFEAVRVSSLDVAFFTNNLAVGFVLLGCEVDYLSEKDVNNAAANPNGLPWDFFITFNEMCYGLMSGDRPLYDAAGVPLISVNVDRPYHLTNQRLGGVENIIHTWIAQDDLRYSDQLYFTSGQHVFLAHGADMLFDIGNALRRDRPVDVLVTGNIRTENLIDKLEAELPTTTIALVREITAYALAHMKDPLEDCVTDWFAAKGAASDAQTLESVMHVAGFHIDAYRRDLKKRQVVAALLEAGIEVHCIGGGWEQSELSAHPLLILHGHRDIRVCRELIGRAKILLNVMPVFRSGAHERVFDAMIRGALCVTDCDNEYLSSQFVEGVDFVTYDYADLDGLAEKIQYYLTHEHERQAITEAAFDKVLRFHTWAHRSQEIAEIYLNWMKAR